MRTSGRYNDGTRKFTPFNFAIPLQLFFVVLIPGFGKEKTGKS